MVRRFHILPLLIFTLLAITSVRAQGTDTTVSSLMSRAYEVMNSNPSEAERLFNEVVVRDPQNVAARRELGYLALAEKNNDEALAHFQESEKLLPSDTIKLQIGYILANM